MYGILVSGLFTFLGAALRTVVVKFVVFAALFAIVSAFIAYLATKLPDFAASLNLAFVGITPGMWYFLDTFSIAQGLPLVIAAYILRFMIRRIPVIG
ncbi:MAG: DUF2523 family protein [Pseudomonadota bacterium]